MREWMWPGLRRRIDRIESAAAVRIEEGRPLRSKHRLPSAESRGSLSGRAVLVPARAALVVIVVVAVLMGAVGALIDTSRAPVAGLAGVFAWFAADQWYVLGARRLGLLPGTAEG